jgi:pimeloyl-ACP methyl ester carboxylesterase
MSETPSAEFRWLESGTGEPVLLLHGLLGDMHQWEASMESLAEACRPLALSMPIFDPRLADASIGGLAQHVVRFLDALDLSRAVIAGNSLGGRVALEVALRHPERVGGLVLAGSSGLGGRGFARTPHRPTPEVVRRRIEQAVHDAALVTPAWVQAVRSLVTTRPTAGRFVRFARAATRDDVAERLGALRAPTLIVWGREDRITPLPQGERFHASIAGSQLWVLTPCGHLPMLEQPQAFAAVVREWLEDTWARRAGVALVEEVAR